MNRRLDKGKSWPAKGLQANNSFLKTNALRSNCREIKAV
jgi:hypothetical protein